MIVNLNRGVFGAHSWRSDTPDAVTFLSPTVGVFEFCVSASCTLTLLRPIARADLCLVAGGMPGHAGVVSDNLDGVGGAGGEVLCGDSETDVALPAGTYTVTVGGSGQDTVLTAPDGRTWTARSGYGKPGGRGNDRDGVLAWGDENTLLNAGWLYGAGGGSGATHVPGDARQASAPGGSVGAASDDTMVGHGGGIGTKAEEHQQGWDGCAGTGQGGGGGRYWYNSGWYGQDGGAGGSGCVRIRTHKEVAA